MKTKGIFASLFTVKRIWEIWKQKWAVETDRRMAWIFLVFAITGSLTVVVRKSLFKAMGIEMDNAVLFFIVKLLAIYVVYQILLFLIGSIMGEHRFVKWFIAKMNKRLIPKRSKNA